MPLEEPLPALGSTDSALIGDLLARVKALETRVSVLEGLEAAGAAPEALPLPAKEPTDFSPLATLGLAGQVCLILAGAFLIRMLTDGGTLPRGLGVGLGLAYGILWAVLADRTESPQRSAFFVSASALIAFPLLWEATTKFQALAPGGAAATLVSLTVILMAVVWRKSHEALAWMVTLGALAEGWGLMLATSAVEAFSVAFLLLGLGSLWLTYGRRWQGLRWPAALAVDGAVLVLTLLCAWPGGPPPAYRSLSPVRAMLVALALVVVYLGSFSLRILMRQRKVIFFESAQSALVLAVGFGGAVRVAQATGTGAPLLGVTALLAGLGCYAVGFAFREREAEGAWNFTFFTSLGIALAVLGVTTLLAGAALSLVLLALGLAALETGFRTGRNTLRIHGAVYLLGGALSTALLPGALGAFLGQPRLAWPFGWEGLMVLAALVAAHVRMVQRREEEASWLQRTPSFAMGLLGVVGLGGLGFAALVRLLAPLSLQAGVPAALRTAVLSALAIALAGLARAWPRTELRWLVFPVLGITGLKLLLEDMPQGQAGPLVLAFAMFGAALLLAPRLMRQSSGT